MRKLRNLLAYTALVFGGCDHQADQFEPTGLDASNHPVARDSGRERPIRYEDSPTGCHFPSIEYLQANSNGAVELVLEICRNSDVKEDVSVDSSGEDAGPS